MTVRVVQLSDLHLTSSEEARTRGVDVWSALRQVLQAVDELAPDRIVLTGDLATIGRSDTYRQLRRLLEPWWDRVRILPGNHDDRAKLRAELALPEERRTASFSEAVAGWRLIGLDTKRPMRVHGRLGVDQLAWLERELARTPEPALLFLHHPPVRVGTWWLDRDLLRDARDLERVLTESGRVRALFCGHVHQEFQGTLAGSDVFTTPSTAYQFRPRTLVPARLGVEPRGFRVVDLDGDSVATRVVRLA